MPKAPKAAKIPTCMKGHRLPDFGYPRPVCIEVSSAPIWPASGPPDRMTIHVTNGRDQIYSIPGRQLRRRR